MDSFSVTADGPDQTQRIGAVVADRLVAGDVVLLNGDLASGKTTFVQAVVAALGSADPVTSPTFSLAQFYSSDRAPVLHIDTYRLSGLAEYRDLALDEYAETSICLVEWGEKIAESFPRHLSVGFAPSAQSTERRILTFDAQPAGPSALPRFLDLHAAIVKELS
jgi:tRNA threonylcarbamoyladenosine biosynthesis protein TsaE